MRLWSLHPKYLDQKGLVALWREALLAKKALAGETTGYANHPQLQRFKDQEDSLMAINAYLFYVFEEAEKRGYKFDKDKIGKALVGDKIPVTSGQIEYEFGHLKNKLFARAPQDYKKLSKSSNPVPHPLFKIVEGEIEGWEKLV
jgi:hypothetical protein